MTRTSEVTSVDVITMDNPPRRVLEASVTVTDHTTGRFRTVHITAEHRTDPPSQWGRRPGGIINTGHVYDMDGMPCAPGSRGAARDRVSALIVVGLPVDVHDVDPVVVNEMVGRLIDAVS